MKTWKQEQYTTKIVDHENSDKNKTKPNILTLFTDKYQLQFSKLKLIFAYV